MDNDGETPQAGSEGLDPGASPDVTRLTDTQENRDSSATSGKRKDPDEGRRRIVAEILGWLDKAKTEEKRLKYLAHLERLLPLESPEQSILGLTDREELRARLDSRVLIMEKRCRRIGYEQGYKEGFRLGYNEVAGIGQSDGTQDSSKTHRPRRRHARRRRRRR